jgi:hypothetical protein
MKAGRVLLLLGPTRSKCYCRCHYNRNCILVMHGAYALFAQFLVCVHTEDVTAVCFYIREELSLLLHDVFMFLLAGFLITFFFLRIISA